MFMLRIPEVQAVVPRPIVVDPDEMSMDPQTFRDLEIFEATNGPSLYDLVNSTRTLGGGKVLAARMKKPLKSAERIRAVQESLAYVRAHRPAFDRLPSTLVTHEVQSYLTGSLPLVNADRGAQFLIEAASLRFGDFRPYGQIVRGVVRTSKLVRALKSLVAGDALPAAGRGEVGFLLDEVRALVSKPAFDAVSPPRPGAALPRPSAPPSPRRRPARCRARRRGCG